MAILDTVKKGYLYIKTSTGYMRHLPRTLASLVDMDDGSSVQTTITNLKNSLKTGAYATIVNNATTTAANTVLDGRMGKNLQDQITSLNSTLATIFKTTKITATTNSSGIADTGISINKYIFGIYTTDGSLCIPMIYGTTYRVMICSNTLQPIKNTACTFHVYYSDVI